MRLVHAIIGAAAYSFTRPAARLAPIAPETPVIIEPWRPAAMTDQPDPIAEFVCDALKASAGARTPAIAVLAAYEAWAKRQDRRAADREAVLDRLRHYTTVLDMPRQGPCLIGVELYPFAARLAGLRPGDTLQVNTPSPALRAIPGLRSRVLADAALLSAELLAVIQSARDLLEVGTEEPGLAGDVIRMAAALLDDAIADAAAPTAWPAP